MLHSWRLSLKLPLPLSPPILNHSWSVGIVPCHVRPAGDLGNVQRRYVNNNNYNTFFVITYCSCRVTRSATLATRFGTYTNGTALISSPPSSMLKVKPPISAATLSSLIDLARVRCLCSLARETFSVFNHLNSMVNFDFQHDEQLILCTF